LFEYRGRCGVRLTRAEPAERDGLYLWIAAAALLVTAIGWGLFAWHVGHGREAELERARSLVRSLSRTLAEHTAQAFFGVEYALRSFDERSDLPGINVRGPPALVHQRLRQIFETNPVFGGLALVDRDGIVVANAFSPEGSGADLSARVSYRSLRDTPYAGLLITPPVRQLPSNSWVIPVNLRLVDSDGRFDGMISAALRPEYFRDIYRASAVPVAALAMNDGTLLSREPGGDANYERGARVGRDALLAAQSGGSGVGEIVSGQDGVRRIAGYAVVRGYPMTVFTAIDYDAALAGWLVETRRALTAAIASTVLILIFAVLLLRRLRRQQEMGRQIELAHDAAQEARLAAEAAVRAKSEFLAHMSHELRTPLNAINGFSDMMAQGYFGPLGDARYADYARHINAAGRHLLSIINTILDMAKVDAGKWEVALAPLRVSELAADIASLTQGRAADHGVRLSIELPDRLPPIVTDRRLLLQILINLATNGIKFTPRGGAVRIVGTVDGKHLLLEVQDTGVGMSAEDLEQVLQPFGHGNSELARKHHDTGLGLLLSKRFTELLGGSFVLASGPDRGTTVALRLPLQAAPLPQAQDAAAGRQALAQAPAY
jgi:signal transduction histidine kinase